MTTVAVDRGENLHSCPRALDKLFQRLILFILFKSFEIKKIYFVTK